MQRNKGYIGIQLNYSSSGNYRGRYEKQLKLIVYDGTKEQFLVMTGSLSSCFVVTDKIVCTDGKIINQEANTATPDFSIDKSSQKRLNEYGMINVYDMPTKPESVIRRIEIRG